MSTPKQISRRKADGGIVQGRFLVTRLPDNSKARTRSTRRVSQKFYFPCTQEIGSLLQIQEGDPVELVVCKDLRKQLGWVSGGYRVWRIKK
jgi:hypothetical protein